MNEILNKLNGYDAKESVELQLIANTVLDITKLYEEQKISQSEYQELLGDIQLESAITSDASALNAKAQLKLIIDTAITIAATAAKAV
jgi:hypothetical protein